MKKILMIRKYQMALNNIFMLLSLLLVAFGFYSCGNNAKNDIQEKEDLKARAVKVYIDESIFRLVEKPILQFDTIDANCEVTFQKVSAWESMAKLLSGETDAIILSRDYTHYEDSLMEAFHVKTYLKMPLAFDALVFYTKYDYALDSLTDNQIKTVLSDKKAGLMKFYPKLKAEPEFVTNSHLSAEAVNLKKLVLGNLVEQKKIRMLGTSDSAMDYVKLHDNTIGIGYLSQVQKHPEFKILRISYVDFSGKYIFPRVVHQSNIVRKLYPYIVTHYIYIYDQKKDASMRLGRYLSKHGNAQKYFLDQGIAPAFAKIQITDEG